MEKIVIEYSTGGEYEETYHTKAVVYKSLKEAKDDFELAFWATLDLLKKHWAEVSIEEAKYEKMQREQLHHKKHSPEAMQEQHKKLFQMQHHDRDVHKFKLGDAIFDFFDFNYKSNKEEYNYNAPSFTILDKWFEQRLRASKS